ncbi:hypothetical protein H257_00395 [Aphanomyces astaci]|uniref:squalene monooxygenase n=1 Tax=Aphanomyces astaci TaxID=112090 RepID=W4HAJ6_APHAT|nr:hypothetical protein H257_00395 [Aphanomyces astaci]ETV88977.1 hypothetical protein H257_00395 [Aphanomyces astaci]RQM19864.1 hypothetical protein B5M09_000638 [Aphanomyces astaci]|eukprot:XP_009821377.1 hypothetical protein H257_00395 [Aphanomyces astaci]
MILVICSVVILSETMRTLLQDSFAVLCQQLADSPLFYSLLLVVLSTCCLIRASLLHTFNATALLVGGMGLASLRLNSVGEIDVHSLSLASAVSIFVAVYVVGLGCIWSVTQTLHDNQCDVKIDNPSADVIIVGAGTAGCSMAVGLAKQGRKVLVIEKSLEYQDRFVGELMQPGGLEALRSLDLIECAETSTDVKTLGYSILLPHSDHIMLPYPDRAPHTFLEYMGLSRADNGTGKQHGRGFHNGAFVQRLRARMLAEPNVTVVEGTVSKLLLEQPAKSSTSVCTGIQFRRKALSDDVEMPVETASAPLVIASDGLWSGLRRDLSTDVPKQISSFVAILMTHPAMEATVPFRNFGHVILAHPSPILMYQISPTETRVLVDVPGKVPSSSNGDLTKHLLTHVAPQIPDASRAAFVRAVETGPVKSMPNREFMTTQPAHIGRVVMLGDTFNMRHPLTGGGMSVALKDVVLLNNLLKNVDLSSGKDVAAVRRAFEQDRVHHSSTVNILANALYHIFSVPSADDDDKHVLAARATLRESCYEYLKMGGVFMAGPLGLLSALTPKPFVLATHFFMVAGYAAIRCLAPFPTPYRLYHCFQVFHQACVIIMPLLERENVTILAWAPLRALINVIFPYRK